MELNSRLLLKNLRNSAEEEVAIEVTDVSKTGIGFLCGVPLTIGTVYEAYLTIWMKEVVHAFLEIVRIERIGEDQYNYGAIFIGMPESELQRISVHDTMKNMEEPEK